VTETYTKHELLEFVLESADEDEGRGDTSIDDVVADDTAETPSEKTIRNRFGTWRRAVRQAGYEPRPSDPQE
jgi:hypothetical protein